MLSRNKPPKIARYWSTNQKKIEVKIEDLSETKNQRNIPETLVAQDSVDHTNCEMRECICIDFDSVLFNEEIMSEY